ncbi:MAG: hypothetical protein Q8O99_07070 [bacterium]|nr:hypothetical protein [bacterium]
MIHPSFIDEIKKILPTDQLDPFLDACQRPLKKSISICTGKTGTEEFIKLTKPRGWHLMPNPFRSDPTSFYIDRDDTSIALGRTFLYQAGFFYIQELAASLPATQIDTRPGDLILDLAAAP